LSCSRLFFISDPLTLVFYTLSLHDALPISFIDTVVVCTITALVLVFTGYADGSSGLEGTELTSAAFGSVFPWFTLILVFAIFLLDRKSTRLNSSHVKISYAVFCLKKKTPSI